jgi:hypothetical protein
MPDASGSHTAQCSCPEGDLDRVVDSISTGTGSSSIRARHLITLILRADRRTDDDDLHGAMRPSMARGAPSTEPQQTTRESDAINASSHGSRPIGVQASQAPDRRRLRRNLGADGRCRTDGTHANAMRMSELMKARIA